MPSIGIVVSDYREEMTRKMLAQAKKTAKELNAEITEITHVPGAFETPLAAKRLLKKGVDAVVVIAVILQGDTHHDVMVGENAYRKLADLSLEFEKPVCTAIIGPRTTKELALERLESYAEHAVIAAIQML